MHWLCGVVVAVLSMSLLLHSSVFSTRATAAAAAAAAGSRRAVEVVFNHQRQLARGCFASGAC
jgi:hypothetical protein